MKRLTDIYSTPTSEKEAAAERIMPLWNSKCALGQQLITTRKRFTTTGPPPMPPRVVLSSPTRSQSRSRIGSRERVRPRARVSSSNSLSPSPERRRGRRRRSSSIESVRRAFLPPGVDPNGETDSIPSRSPSPDSDDGGKLTGHEVDSPREEKVGTVGKQIFKSFLQPKKSQKSHIPGVAASNFCNAMARVASRKSSSAVCLFEVECLH
jgi:hypothetical protein